MVNFGRLPLLSWIKNVTKTKPCKETLKTRFLSPAVILLQVVSNITCRPRDEFLVFTAFASVEDILKMSQSVDAISSALFPGRPPTMIMLMAQI